MLKKLKRKFTEFFEGYFVEILKQQEKTNAELLQSKERIHNLENELALVKADLNARIAAAESSLNYYSMIRSIMDENTYVGHEIVSLSLQKTDFPKILIAGFYGADNFGDEIMLQTLLSAIPEERLSSVTVMLCDNPDYDYFHLPGVNFIHLPKKTFDCNLLAQHFDVLIWGGGALIDDKFYDRSPLELNNLFLALSERFIAFKKKVISLGLSTNQNFSHPEFCERLKNVVNSSTYFSIRDTNSIEVLKKLGIENVDFLEDIVFYHKIWESNVPAKTVSDCPTIGIIWICCEETEALLGKVMKKIFKTYGENSKIHLIPFYNYLQIDTEFYSAVIEKYSCSENVSVVPYTNSIEKMVNVIATCDYMINMRYHGMLLCGMIGTPTLNICYDVHRHYENKINYLADLFQVKDGLEYFSEFNKKLEISKLEFLSSKKTKGELAKSCDSLTNLLFSKVKD